MGEKGKLASALPAQRIVVSIFGALLLAIILGAFYLRSVFIPVIVSYFLAFLFNPLIDRAESRGFGRVGPIVFVLFVSFGSASLFLGTMMPKLVSQFHQLIAMIPDIGELLVSFISPYAQEYLNINLLYEWNQLAFNVLPKFSNIPSGGLLGNVFSGALQALGTVLMILIVPVLTFYLLKDYNTLNESVLGYVPRRFEPHVSEVVHRLGITTGALVRGQFLICIVLAFYYSVALSAIGLPMPLVLGAFSGLLNLVPVVGPLGAAIITMLIAAIGDASISVQITILGIFLIAGLIESTVIRPRLAAQKIQLNPLTIILVLLVGGELLGFFGMLIALPFTVIVKVLGGYLSEKYFASDYYNRQLENTIEEKTDAN